MTVHVGDKVGSLARREPVLADPGETLRSVAHTLWTEAVGVLIVGDARRPLGVISERDIVAALAQGADADTMTAEEVMTTHIICVRRGDPLFDAAGQMLDADVRHLPIVDENGDVVGMVSVRDLVRPLLVDAFSGKPI